MYVEIPSCQDYNDKNAVLINPSPGRHRNNQRDQLALQVAPTPLDSMESMVTTRDWGGKKGTVAQPELWRRG